MKLLERPGKKRDRIKSVEALAEQREVEKSYSAQLLGQFEKNGIKNLSFSDESLVLAKAVNPEVLRLQKNPQIHVQSVAHVSAPRDEVRGLSAGALACLGFPQEKTRIQSFLRNAYPRLLDKIMQGFYAGFSTDESSTREVRLPALARLLGLVSDDQIEKFNDENLARWKNIFKQSLGQFDGPKITDQFWLENELNMALALEVLEAEKAYITEDGKPMLVRKGSLGTAAHPLPERLTA